MLDYILQVKVINKKIGFGDARKCIKMLSKCITKIMEIFANELKNRKLTKTWSIDQVLTGQQWPIKGYLIGLTNA